MLGWVVRGVRDDAVREGRFPVYGGNPLSGCLMNGDVQEIYVVVGFRFSGKFHIGVQLVEVFLYVCDVCLAGVVYYQDVVYISKVGCDVVFVKELPQVCVLKVLKKELGYEP